MSIESYESIVNKIESARRFGKLPGVEVSRRMLEYLQLSMEELPYIHVAGTNGKGSTCAFLTGILMAAGLKVGTFTSPHLVDFRERIRVNNEILPREKVETIGQELLQMDCGVSGTMFDYCMIMAVKYFLEQECDIAIMETGLGGRLDSTNALGVPEVAVITKIGLDHMEILGDNVAAIAGEKAGILKQGSYAIFQQQEESAMEVLVREAKQVDCPYQVVTDKEIQALAHIQMRSLGEYQRENAAGAVAAARRILEARGFPQEKIEKAIQTGLETTLWEGRMELVREKPFLLLDGAHNGHGVKALAGSLKALYPGEKFHFIMGVMADKDYEKMVEEMLPLAEDFTTVTVESSRALQAEKLCQYIKGKQVKACVCEDVKSLLEEQRKWDNKTVVFGSLYFIGQVKEILSREL